MLQQTPFNAVRSIAVELRSLIYEKINKCLPTLQKLLVLGIINFIIEPTFFQQALQTKKCEGFSNEKTAQSNKSKLHIYS